MDNYTNETNAYIPPSPAHPKRDEPARVGFFTEMQQIEIKDFGPFWSATYAGGKAALNPNSMASMPWILRSLISKRNNVRTW